MKNSIKPTSHSLLLPSTVAYSRAQEHEESKFRIEFPDDLTFVEANRNKFNLTFKDVQVEQRLPKQQQRHIIIFGGYFCIK